MGEIYLKGWRQGGQTTRVALLLFFVITALLFVSGALYRAPAVQADAGLPDGVDATPMPAEEPEGQKLIALTFDDGPRRSTTTRLLDGLAARGVKGTFFLIGSLTEGNEDVIRRMDAEGHQIGIHTYDHVKLTSLSQADFEAQVGRTRSLLKQILGHNDFLLRPPFGMLDTGVKTHAGCPIILWSIDPEDWKDQNAPREVAQIVSEAKDGDIILMHDIFPASVDAALQVVDALHAKGFLFCTIDELFATRGIELEAGKMYWNAYP